LREDADQSGIAVMDISRRHQPVVLLFENWWVYLRFIDT
jgi:hypothetical protein